MINSHRQKPEGALVLNLSVLPDPEKERKEIIHRYRRLLRQAKPILKEGDARLIRKAFNLALEAHRNMRRKLREPYIFHPLAVAEICVGEIGLGTTSIISALVHDVVEDTDIELADIEKMFGRKIARIVDGLTKIKGVFEQGTSAQAENFRKMLFTLSGYIDKACRSFAQHAHARQHAAPESVAHFLRDDLFVCTACPPSWS